MTCILPTRSVATLHYSALNLQREMQRPHVVSNPGNVPILEALQIQHQSLNQSSLATVMVVSSEATNLVVEMAAMAFTLCPLPCNR